MEKLLEKAEQLLSKPLQDRDLSDLSLMSDIKFRIWVTIPLAKRDLREKELESDTIEKSKFLELKKQKKEKKTSMTEADMKAFCRLKKNEIDTETIDLENKYLTLYAFYQELQDAVVSTRMMIKM